MQRILIIDDDVSIRIAFKKLLIRDNYNVQLARNEKEALQYLKDEFFDLVLLDLRLPPTGWEAGFRILAQKKNIPLNAETPVIIVSGALDMETIGRRVSIEDNVAHILLKPVENEKILQAIRDVLG